MKIVPPYKICLGLTHNCQGYVPSASTVMATVFWNSQGFLEKWQDNNW